MTTTNKKHKANEKCNKDINQLADIISDINEKMSQIIDQISDISATIETINDSVRYGRDYKDFASANEDN